MNLKQRLQESTDSRAVELLNEFEALEVLQRCLERKAERVLVQEYIEVTNNLLSPEAIAALEERWFKELPGLNESEKAPDWFTQLPVSETPEQAKESLMMFGGVKVKTPQVEPVSNIENWDALTKPDLVTYEGTAQCVDCGNEAGERNFYKGKGPLCDICLLGTKAVEFLKSGSPPRFYNGK